MKRRASIGFLVALAALAWPGWIGALDASQTEVVPAAASADPFSRGDQTISLSASLNLPIAIVPDTVAPGKPRMYTGGSISFSYSYFLTPRISLGASLSGAFNGTVGSRTLFVAPLGVRFAYWWLVETTRIGFVAESGAYLMRLGSQGMAGPYLKTGATGLWTISRDWSIGAQVLLGLIPEIHTGAHASETRYGVFLETGVSAIYHL